MFWSRPDGDPVTDAPPLRGVMPFLMPTRGESVVFLEQLVEVEALQAWLQRRNALRAGEPPVRLFHAVLWALATTLHERPALNRFIAGGRLHQRRQVQLSYAVKIAAEESAPINTVKLTFPPGLDLDGVARLASDSAGTARSGKESTAEVETRLIAQLPRPVRWLLFGAYRWLNALDLLPAAMIDSDPLFCSVFVANLGSLRLNSAYHHLYEIGTCPLFCTIGRAAPMPWALPDGSLGVRTVLPLRFTYDERIGDGFIAAAGIERLTELLRDLPQTELA